MLVKKLTTIFQKLTVLSILLLSINLYSSEKIVLGITGVALKDDILTLMNFKDYLSKETGLDIQLKFARSYAVMKSFLQENNVDVAYICGATYVDLQPTNKVELLVLPIVDNKPNYYSFIISKLNSPYNNLLDFKNKLFAMSDPESNSGFFVPNYEIVKHGYSMNDFFKKKIFTYDHGESIQAVLSGYADGASVDSIVYKAFEVKHPLEAKKLKIVEKFGPYPIPPFVVRKSLSKNIKTQIQNALLGMSNEKTGKNILKSMAIERFIKPQNISYEKIKNIKNIKMFVQTDIYKVEK